uniref:Globin family profile domain-containing protein n=1 Tax=Globodera rostochiensis TaxID=31243 RepID=A0A914HK59_GLORO
MFYSRLAHSFLIILFLVSSIASEFLLRPPIRITPKPPVVTTENPHGPFALPEPADGFEFIGFGDGNNGIRRNAQRKGKLRHCTFKYIPSSCNQTEQCDTFRLCVQITGDPCCAPGEGECPTPAQLDVSCLKDCAKSALCCDTGCGNWLFLNCTSASSTFCDGFSGHLRSIRDGTTDSRKAVEIKSAEPGERTASHGRHAVAWMGQSQGTPQPQTESQSKGGFNAGRKVSEGGSVCAKQQQQQQKRRQSRSKSLEPNAALEIGAIEHRKSAQYGPKTDLKKSRIQELWNPEKAAAQLIGQQLQNPHSQHPALQQACAIRMKQFRNQSGGQNDLLEDKKKDAVTGMSAHQIQILQKIWERSPESEISDCARNIMSHLLRSNAQMYQFFDLLGHSDREIANSPIFARQSANFAVLLDFVLANLLEEVQKVCLALQHLGAQHARLRWPIENHHWALFCRCFEDNPPKEVFLNAEGHDLWKTMINFIIVQMRVGYDRTIGASSPRGSSVNASTPRLGAYRRPSEGGKESVCQQRGKWATRSNTLAATEETE